jgi:Ferritin-like domain
MSMNMTNHQDLVPELAAVEVDGISRQAFLVRGALAAGAVYGTSMISPFVRSAMAADPMGDVDILNFALTLEYLEADFYRRGLKLGLSSDVAKIARSFGDAEQQHVEALRATVKKLGGTPVTSPKFKFPMTDEKSFLKLAQTLEDTGVSAYNGAGPSITSKEVLAAAGSIVQIEARHAAVIRLLRGNVPAPDAFDPSLDTKKVLAAVKPLIRA